MATISSHTLFHITKKFSVLKKIIKNGLRYSYSLEKTETETAIIQRNGYIPEDSDKKLQANSLSGNPKTYVAIPMICFCDIPLLRIENHCKKYGKFAIGLNKEILSEIYNNLLNPVWYTESKNVYDLISNYSRIIYYQGKDLFEKNTNKDYLKKIIENDELKKGNQEMIRRYINNKVLANYILGYTKERKDNNTSYYDEREWRSILPDDEDIAEWIWNIDEKYFDLHRKKWNDSMDKNEEYGHIILTSELLNDAITHIIVDTDKRIPDVINYIMSTKSIFGVSDISLEQRLLLISKITSFEKINKDY